MTTNYHHAASIITATRTPSEQLAALARERGVTLAPYLVSGFAISRNGERLATVANVAEATRFVEQLYTPEELKHFQEVNRK